MTWVLRFVVWATVLAPLCYLLMAPYERLVGAAATLAAHALGVPVQVHELRTFAPFTIGQYIAMCLASTRACGGRVRIGILCGVPILALSEALLVILIVSWYGIASRGIWVPGSPVTRLASTLLDLVPWLSAPVVWLIVVGRWELEGTAFLPARPAKIPSS